MGNVRLTVQIEIAHSGFVHEGTLRLRLDDVVALLRTDPLSDVEEEARDVLARGLGYSPVETEALRHRKPTELTVEVAKKLSYDGEE